MNDLKFLSNLPPGRITHFSEPTLGIRLVFSYYSFVSISAAYWAFQRFILNINLTRNCMENRRRFDIYDTVIEVYSHHLASNIKGRRSAN
jgi:hypothetical protein